MSYTIDGYYSKINLYRDYKPILEKFEIPNIKPMLKGLKKDISTAVDKLTDDNIDYRLSNNIPIKTFDKKKNPLEISINNKNEVCLVKNNVLVCVGEESFKIKDKT
jgi:hypothetical protein